MIDSKLCETELELLRLKKILSTALHSDLDKKAHSGSKIKRFMFCYYADRFTTAGKSQIAEIINYTKEFVAEAIREINQRLDEKDPEILELYLRSEWQIWEAFGERSEFDII